MKILIAGATNIGQFIAKYLNRENFDLTIIDKNVNLVKELTDQEAMAGIVGLCTDINTLKDADIKGTDIIISTTDSDDTNILMCCIANLYGVQTKIAYLQNPTYLNDGWVEYFTPNKIPVNYSITIGKDVVESIQRRIDYSYLNISDIIDFANGNIKVFSLFCTEGCKAINKNISSISAFFYQNELKSKVVGILRNKQYIIPTETDVIKLYDKIFISSIQNEIQDTYAAFYNIDDIDSKILDNQSPNIVLAGNHSLISIFALELAKKYNKIKVVANEDGYSTNLLSTELEKYNIKIITDDITKPEYRDNYLKSSDDIIIILNEKDEDTVLNTMLLKHQGFKNTMSYLNSSHYEEFLHDNQINHILIPDHFIMSPILINIRRGVILNIFSVHKDIEIVEFEITSKSNALGKRLSDIEISRGVVINAVLNEDDLPLQLDKDIIIRNNYKIILTSTRRYIADIEKIFTHIIELDA